jgi:hypothetical protein
VHDADPHDAERHLLAIADRGAGGSCFDMRDVSRLRRLGWVNVRAVEGIGVCEPE